MVMPITVRTWKEASCLYINAGGRLKIWVFNVKNENLGKITAVTEEVKNDSLKM